MKREEIELKVKNFLIEEIEVDEAAIKSDALLKEDLGIDSLDFVDIEKTFGIKIKPEEMAGVKTFEQFCDYIENKVK